MTLTSREVLEKLVSFPTVSRDSNLDLADWVQAFLSDNGVSSHRMLNEDGQKAAVYAHVGPDAPGGVVLSGHTDVVPVDGQAWATDPWVVTEKDGKLFGRGTCDMKGFDALALVALVKASKAQLKRPLQVALSYDEEVGCEGAPPLIERMRENLPPAALAIIGEPSMMKVVTGHKGGSGFKVHVRGFEVHSSLMHTGVNAIMEGAKLIEWCNRMNAAGAAAEPAEGAACFDPPWTSVHVGEISGGTAHNITAKDCHFGVDFRYVPTDSRAEWEARFIEEVRRLEAEMNAVHPDAGIDLVPYFGLPGLRPEDDGPAEQLARKLTGDNASHVVSYGTEAGHFQDAGYSGVICGPGDIAMAHQPNEYLTVEQFTAGEAFMDRLIDHLCQ
ncbi:acetylornithine deacetylase [uncultured Boseongicola sp.]|jgi:acetylornithine deacetylase|uniref:acetylornithine deacetylase n=1 Tax=uncultured Boseongicola sp. TaxID=1648499 RepID=UPI00261BDB15|nr:acetylornithine deacetylase [uncultured Boseongicola sp.]